MSLFEERATLRRLNDLGRMDSIVLRYMFRHPKSLCYHFWRADGRLLVLARNCS